MVCLKCKSKVKLISKKKKVKDIQFKLILMTKIMRNYFSKFKCWGEIGLKIHVCADFAIIF